MNDILNKLHEAAASPRAQMDGYLSQGKKIVLCAPVYTPEEVIHAMGFVPMGAWGGDVALNRAKEYCPAFLCAIVQSLLELGISGAYDGASAIVIPSLCDTLKTVGENWKYAVPSIPFIPMTYPQNRKPAYGVAYTKAGYERVIRDLEKLGGIFSEEKLLASIKVYNRHNAAMRKVDEVLAKHPEITAAQRSDIFKSAFFMTKEEHTELVEALIEKLEAQTPAAEKLPIVISGILTDAPALNAILDEMGLHIVADDVAAQSRQYRTDAPERADALNALAEKFANMDNCSVLYNQDKPRVKWIVDTARARNAKGVLVVLTKFCDPEEFDYVMIKKACEAAGIPLTLVEIELRQPQSRKSDQNEHGKARQLVSSRRHINRIENAGGRQTETDHVGQRIEFLADRRRNLHQAGGESVQKIEYGSDQHAPKSLFEVVDAESEDHGRATRKQIAKGQNIGESKQSQFHTVIRC